MEAEAEEEQVVAALGEAEEAVALAEAGALGTMICPGARVTAPGEVALEVGQWEEWVEWVWVTWEVWEEWVWVEEAGGQAHGAVEEEEEAAP